MSVVTGISNKEQSVDLTDHTSLAGSTTSRYANGTIVLVSVNHHVASGYPTEPTVAGMGVTWTKAEWSTFGDNSASGVWWAYVDAPYELVSNPAITVTYGETQDRSQLSLDYVGYNVDMMAPIVQVVANTGSGTAAVATLAAFGSTRNSTFGAIATEASAADFTPGTNFTEIVDLTLLATQRYYGQDTTVDSTISVSDNWKVIAIELGASDECAHYYTPRSTIASTSTSLTFVSISGEDLQPNTKYLVAVRCLIRSFDLTDKVEFSVRVSDDLSIETASLHRMEAATTTSYYSYLFVRSFETDAAPSGVLLRLDAGGTTIWVAGSSVFLLDLDELGTDNYLEDVVVGDGVELGLTPAAYANIAQTALGTDEWAVLGYMRVGVGSTGVNYFVDLSTKMDGSTNVAVGETTEEGEDTAEERVVGVIGRYKASVAGDANLAIRAWEEGANGNMTNEGSYCIAIKTSAFADFVYDYESGTQAITGEATVATTGSYTPSVGGRHLIMGRIGSVVGTADGDELYGFLEEGTVEVFPNDSNYTHDQGWDVGDDAAQAITQHRVTVTDAQTYNLRAKGGTWTAEDRWLWILNLNLATTGTDYTETATDDADITDDMLRVHDTERTSTDDADVTDNTLRVHNAERSATDPADVTDQALSTLNAKRIVTDPVGVTDQTAVLKTITITISDDIGVTDSVPRVAPAVRTVTDPTDVTDLAIDDLTTEAVDYFETATDPVAVTDQTSRVHDAERTATDDADVADQVVAAKAIARTVTDAISITDDTQAVKAIAVTISDDADVTDSISRIAPAVRVVTDAIGLVDAVTQAEENAEVSVETVGVTDVVVRVHAAERTVTDPAGVIDTVLPVKSIAVTITDPVGVADQTTRVAPAIRSATDSVDIADQVQSDEQNVEQSVEAVGITDSTSRVHEVKRTVTEAVGVTDLAIDDLTIPTVETEIRPVSDVSTAGWDTAPTASQPLWEQLDEEIPSDVDYIFAEAP